MVRDLVKSMVDRMEVEVFRRSRDRFVVLGRRGLRVDRFLKVCVSMG